MNMKRRKKKNFVWHKAQSRKILCSVCVCARESSVWRLAFLLCMHVCGRWMTLYMKYGNSFVYIQTALFNVHWVDAFHRMWITSWRWRSHTGAFKHTNKACVVSVVYVVADVVDSTTTIPAICTWLCVLPFIHTQTILTTLWLYAFLYFHHSFFQLSLSLSRTWLCVIVVLCFGHNVLVVVEI